MVRFLLLFFLLYEDKWVDIACADQSFVHLDDDVEDVHPLISISSSWGKQFHVAII